MDENQPATPAAPAAVLIESLDQLQQLVECPIYCEFKLDGKLIRLPCKRINQGLDEKVRAIRREAQPPYDERRKDYNYFDPAFLRLRDRNDKVARAMIVYAGCPAIAAKRPGLVDKEEIHLFVSTVLSENILDLIAATIQVGGMELVDRANFISTSASEN
jgi:hypothetical protein